MDSFSVIGLTSVLEHLLPEPHAGLLSGLLFGTKATLSKELYDQLITTGTIHIIALSGMNITILIDLVATSLNRFVSKRMASMLTIGVICWFVWFVGGTATIIRAAIMGTLTLIALIFGRQYWALLSLMLAVGLMLLVHPSWVTEISFQLSVAATLGIILFGSMEKRVHDRKNMPKFVAIFFYGIEENFRLTMAAQVFTIPIIFHYFHRISFISPLTNVAIGWVIAPVTTLGWLACVLGFVWLPLGIVPAWMSWVMLEYLVRTVQILSHVPYASVGL